GIGFPLALAFDRSGRLYVLNGLFGGGTDVTVYAAASLTLAYTIEAGVINASAIALDSHDNLYVANDGDKRAPESVTEYARGTVTPLRTISTGIRHPIALALDARGNLYVANSPSGTSTVTVYAPHMNSPVRTYVLSESATALAIR
ncbi:MAG: hypothetical protein JO199_00635, partial [Candidatus Eremiobacteraeota bacterium]|nr:hypothetical protein [Candidatus Eremiobacteraeota bacterium]